MQFPDQHHQHSLGTIKNAYFGARPQTCWIWTLRVRPRNLCFTKPARWFWSTLMLENDYAKKNAAELSSGRKRDYKNIGSFCTQVVFQRSFSSWLSLEKQKPKIDNASWYSLHRKNNQNSIQQAIFKEMAFASHLKIGKWMNIWYKLTYKCLEVLVSVFMIPCFNLLFFSLLSSC